MKKSPFEHPAYRDAAEDPNANTPEEIAEGKKAAGTTTHEEWMKRFIELEPDWKKPEEDNDWSIESFSKLVDESNQEKFEELLGEMKDYEGDREKIFEIAINKALEFAGNNPDQAIRLASKFDSLRCAHLFLCKYAENNDVDIEKLHSLLGEVDARAEEEKGGPAFQATKVLIEKALQNYKEKDTELSLDRVVEICTCCTYQVRKYPRVELETKMLEALSPFLKGMKVTEYMEIQKKLPTNLLKYESLVSFADENEGNLSLNEIVTLMDTVELEDFFKELRDGTLLSLIVACEDQIESAADGDVEKLREHIKRLTPRAQGSPGIVQLLKKIDLKLKDAPEDSKVYAK